MKCKKHVADLTSTIGVCASCLRERLFVLIAAQEQAHAAQQAAAAAVVQEDRRKSEVNPPPLLFPRSVSPYISRRKSDTNSDTWIDPGRHNHHHHHHHYLHSLSDQRFYSTPQVGPSGTLVAAGSCVKKKSGIRFSLFGNLFRSKSEKLDSDPAASGSGQDSVSSPSWFSTILPGRQKKQNRTFSLDESMIGGGQRRVCRNPDRGMSPARYSDEEEEHCYNGSSGYSSESSQPWKQTPRRTPASVAPGKRHGGGGRAAHNRNVAGISFCLSPLVRASPSRLWNQKGVPPEMVASGEIRVVPVKPNLANASPFCKNRSRKLADFGRSHHNR